MTIKKALEHFQFKFQKSWKPTEADVKAFNTIIEFVEAKHQQQLTDNEMFAKLYIMVYSQYLDRYKATVFDDIPVKELNKLLKKPLDVFIERFTRNLNDNEQYQLMQEIGIKSDHPATKTQDIKDKESESLLNLTDEQKERLFGQVWEIETVKDNLILQINNVLNLK